MHSIAPAESPALSNRIALSCPDAQSVVALCTGLIRTIAAERDAKIYSLGELGLYSPEIHELPVEHLDIPMRRYIGIVDDFKYMIAVYRTLRRLRPQVLINFTTKPNIYGTIAGRLSGVKTIVCAVRGLGSPFSEGGGLKSRCLKALLVCLYGLAFRMSKKVWFTNPGDLDYSVKHGLVDVRKCFLTKNCVNIALFSRRALEPERQAALRRELGLADDDQVIVMVARLLWAKGVREYVEAARLVRRNRKNLRFLLVGPLEDGNLGAVPESYVRSSEQEQLIQWLGHRKDVRDIYGLADVAVLPSYYKEGGYPRALLEPMALGVAVVGADTADCRGPIADGLNGLLTPVKSADALAERIEALLDDDALRQRIGTAARKTIESDFNEMDVARAVLTACDF